MKRVYSRLFILWCFLFSFEIISVNAANYSNELLEANKMSTAVWAGVSVNAAVNGTTAVCVNDAAPTVTFTGSGGTSPYTFTYKDKNGVENDIQSDASTGVGILSVSTTTAGTFTYTLTSVKDVNGNVQNITNQVATVIVNAAPDAGFTFLNNQCSGSAISFTSNAVGSYTYAWDFGDGTTSTEANPTHQFSTTGNSTASFTVKLIVSGNPSTCSQSTTKTITVQQAPDPTLHASVESATDNGVPVFKTCSSSATDITFSNVSSTASSANASYTISWGDGTPDFTATTWNLQTHKYDLGLWTLTYTVT